MSRKRYGYVLLVRKEDYCIQRKTFDRLNRKYKRQFQAQERQKIEDKLSEINQHDFWKSIGKIGIANERKNCIPLAVLDNDGSIKTDKNYVLNKWKNDFHTLFQRMVLETLSLIVQNLILKLMYLC